MVSPIPYRKRSPGTLLRKIVKGLKMNHRTAIIHRKKKQKNCLSKIIQETIKATY